MLTIENQFPDVDCIVIKTHDGETIEVYRNARDETIVTVNQASGSTTLVLGEETPE